MLSVALGCLNDVYVGEKCKPLSCANVTYILVCINKKLNRHNHHKSVQFVIKPTNRQSTPSPSIYEPFAILGVKQFLRLSASVL
jgi:hypothetical protein